MADGNPIGDLPILTGASVDPDADLLPIVDASATAEGTTKRITVKELIANTSSFVQSGIGALTETVQAALRRFVHTAQYSTQGNYETARDALTGTIGVQNLDIAGRLKFPSLPDPAQVIIFETSNAGAADFAFTQFNATFNGTVDSVLTYGYNVAANGARVDTNEPSIALQIEHNYYDGSINWLEFIVGGQHINGNVLRPLMFGINRSTREIISTFNAETYSFLDGTGVNQFLKFLATTTTAAITLNSGTTIAHAVNNVGWLYQLNTSAGNQEIARVNASNRVVIGPAGGAPISIGNGNTFLLEDTADGNARISTTQIQTLDSAQLWLRNTAGSVIYWTRDANGHLTAGTDNSYDIGATGALRPRTIYAGTSVVAPAYTVGSTAGASFNGAVTNITVVNGIVTAAS